ncbi:divalent-cation tolerance protein CutA [Hyphomicrobium sp. D-2]|uniref:divalent-cation tolerance protein CutA n=1 Tax=Hyphomicrobium sp. D-2 TaxID=3041621 RepID=UPI0024590225|nr:divalent-cation tolerance protein CutA [Hyphomicrobium sp. D-2]MDH4981275.1 divalent-cation tolerance protein CutA [Hyphomicrobium sp. D-2]
MQQNDKPVLVYSTFPSAEVAEQVARELIERRLVACVNILPGMTSIYRWDGTINRDSEVVAIIKTRSQLAAKVMQEVAARHPYDHPALLVIEVADGAADYLNWLMAETAGPD